MVKGKKKKIIKKTINQSSGFLIIGILAIISILIIIGVPSYNNIQSEVVYPTWTTVSDKSNVPYEKVRDYQFCHQYECEDNCLPFPDRKCEYYAKGTTANCPIFMDKTGTSWQPHWKCK